MAYCYILYSATLNKYYVGHTADSLEQRVRRHLSNHKGFTGSVADWQMVYAEKFDLKSEAAAKEMFIKKQKSRKFIEKLIAGSVHPDL